MTHDGHVVAVMVPLAAQGHLNQLLHLSRLISARNIPVHYIGAATHNRQAKLRIHGWDPSELANLHFHDFIIPPIPSPPPNPKAETMFPAHLIPSFRTAAIHLRDPLTHLLRSLSSQTRRIIVIHDSLMASTVEDIESIPNAESYNFHSVSAFAMAIYDLEQEETKGKENSIIKDLNIPSLDGCFTPEFWEFVELQFGVPRKFSGNLYNTCKAIEEPYLEILQRINHETKHWAIGPFNPVELGPSNLNTHPCLEWLDQQQTNSVVYVSFGTTTALEDEQILEIAGGLERSGQKFIWVLRDADKGDVFDGEVRKSELPEGFEKRMKMEGRGLVVRDWAPQLAILSHGSTGGFVSHCGWNSCMETITMGVPVAAWPMHSDQPRNAVLMTEVLRVGLNIRDWAHRDKLVMATTIENALRKLMVSEEGQVMRKTAKELGVNVRRSVEDKGVSRVEFDSFISHITRDT
ncbi:zeatin O-glucosyltransferase-like [Benincasa hispida]|uniref:zeatin O-glucosyltransferase-like n=1 Tax=Benincasa hispida TaxID=102211 RepID=UPI001900FEE7|nr:zeatin O-glucosyltransferase-like [Benincasa hispida]